MGVNYFASVPGILKAIQTIFNFIAMICIATSYTSSEGDAFLACSISALILTLVLFVIYTFDVNDKVPIPWLFVEIIFCAVWALFYIVTSSLVIRLRLDAYIAGGEFGLFAAIMYLVNIATLLVKKD